MKLVVSLLLTACFAYVQVTDNSKSVYLKSGASIEPSISTSDMRFDRKDFQSGYSITGWLGIESVQVGLKNPSEVLSLSDNNMGCYPCVKVSDVDV